MQARYYAPGLGRFVSRDPIGFAGGINLYAYCGGDPVNYGDPSGTVTSINWDGHPIFSFDAQGALAGLKTGGEALRYAFTLSLWKPDKECESAPGWEAAEGPAWLAAGSSYTALGLAIAPAAARMAPSVIAPLSIPFLTAAVSSNPAAEQEAIQAETLCQTVARLTNNITLPAWIINAADEDGNVIIGRALNAGESFGPEGITPSGWGWVHATTDMNMINDLVTKADRPYSATAMINLSDLNSLAQDNDKLLFGDRMREIRVPNYLLSEFASKLIK